MSRIKTMVLSSMLTANALTIFVIESQLPPLAPIPGIKLGLSNIVTLLTILLLGTKAGISVHFLRIFLGTIFTGQAVSFLYSFAGGLCCLLVMLAVSHLPYNLIWLMSILSSIAHIAGQLLIAVWVLGTVSILLYSPILLFTSILTGFFTGMCVQILVKRYPNLFR